MQESNSLSRKLQHNLNGWDVQAGVTNTWKCRYTAAERGEPALRLGFAAPAAKQGSAAAATPGGKSPRVVGTRASSDVQLPGGVSPLCPRPGGALIMMLKLWVLREAPLSCLADELSQRKASKKDETEAPVPLSPDNSHCSAFGFL